MIFTTQNIAGFVDSNVPIAERVANGLGGLPVFLDRDTVMAAMETPGAAEAMAYDGVLPETLVILVEA